MDKWRYRITTHTSADVIGVLAGPVEDVPPSIFCDDEGVCYFDAGPNPFTQAMERLLDEVREEGWELVQVAFRPEQMICFWKQPH
ncbi:MAG: hypothetical protein JXA14_05180 [Anaerolineae bacterium]|jgi:hypothetical protein|nr:hypothetical protein [Anaerolineae bacterium]